MDINQFVSLIDSVQFNLLGEKNRPRQVFTVKPAFFIITSVSAWPWCRMKFFFFFLKACTRLKCVKAPIASLWSLFLPTLMNGCYSDELHSLVPVFNWSQISAPFANHCDKYWLDLLLLQAIAVTISFECIKFRFHQVMTLGRLLWFIARRLCPHLVIDLL